MSDFVVLRDAMRRFTAERKWEKYHDPKSLILALVGEVGELSELFQWLPADRAAELASTDPLRQRASDEIADVLLYLVRLADVLHLDLADVATTKIAANSRKHSEGDPPDAKRPWNAVAIVEQHDNSSS
jgi:NTP pyrophosphatase (non-canonical NTP hydrolase)